LPPSRANHFFLTAVVALEHEGVLRHRAPRDYKPPGCLISGIEMHNDARYGLCGAAAAGTGRPIPWFHDRKVHLSR